MLSADPGHVYENIIAQMLSASVANSEILRFADICFGLCGVLFPNKI
ncbi:MAG: hypothetical protein J5871_00305 [Bacteroidales bacterium]|nr:hypothetical protein [Bacteroidales bacterium]